MTITLALTPEQEILLRESLSKQEHDAARRILHEAVDAVPMEEVCMFDVGRFEPEISREAVQRRLDELAEIGRGAGGLPPEAFSRESIYRDERPQIDARQSHEERDAGIAEFQATVREINDIFASSGPSVVLSDEALSRESVSGPDDRR